MLNIQIDNPELEACIKQTYGESNQSVAKAFADFVQTQSIKQDIEASIDALARCDGTLTATVFNRIRAAYE
jgi:hypothetical protein